MKRSHILMTTLILLVSLWGVAQSNQGFHYQAVVRDASGSPLANSTVNLRFQVFQTSPNGGLVYQETHRLNSNEFGLLQASIGNGAPDFGDFGQIDWGVDRHYLLVEINGIKVDTSLFQAVPYAKLATDMQLAQLRDVDLDRPTVGQTLKWNGSSWALALDERKDADPDSTNELQKLTLSGFELSLNPSGGGVTLPSYSAGTGISVSGTVISNTGDVDASDDLTLGSVAGGDLAGTYPGPRVVQLQGFPVDSATPSFGQVLKWNGTQWAGGSDERDSSLWRQNASTAYYDAGTVGIGTDSTFGTLDILANSSLSFPHLYLRENGNDYARLNFANRNDSNYWTLAAYIASSPRNDRFNIWNGAKGDILSITGDGRMGLNVGISPKTTFHIGDGHRVLFGTDTLGNGDKLMWLPDLHAFRVGTVATGAASTYWNRDSIGLYSFASGLNTRAQGFGATAMGRDTEATNSYAFASGFFTNADGQYSTAMGFNTDAFGLGATALGYSTDAEQNYSFAAGYFAEAQAIYSVAMGNAVKAQSFASMAVGRYNVGGGNASSWVETDPIFEIGIGTGPSSRANAITVRKNGNVGIGTTAPLAALQVNGRIRLQSVEYIEDGGTNEIAVRGDLRPTSDNIYDLGNSALRWDDVYATNGTIQTSDLREKFHVQNLTYGLEEIMQLRPISFSWKGAPHQGVKLGLAAQEVLEVIPEVVKTHDYEPSEESETLTKVEVERLGMYYSDLIPVLIKATQEQQALIQAQQERIQVLEERLSALEND